MESVTLKKKLLRKNLNLFMENHQFNYLCKSP